MSESKLVPITDEELMDVDGGVVGFVLVLAGSFVLGVAAGYGIGYLLG